ncbi:hypothetical protein KOW79_019670 [Hemibagrus wyckioides]|uniref:Uncharacterized protein n=1 Tax=Hemibagrus wyckioides TaxID=337641 RepID=A0A9D3NAJ4_9TELE|nr:hypothetical protein KOW79_019670 [Hemibagrus wyckioides]
MKSDVKSARASRRRFSLTETLASQCAVINTLDSAIHRSRKVFQREVHSSPSHRLERTLRGSRCACA